MPDGEEVLGEEYDEFWYPFPEEEDWDNQDTHALTATEYYESLARQTT